jgi:hypothetical protein
MKGKIMKPLKRQFYLCVCVSLLGFLFAPGVIFAETINFTGGELLGKPTDTSITINIVPDSTIEYYYEYGIDEGGPYAAQTSPMTAAGGQPHEIVITGLSPDTRYYYRMVYDGDGDVNDGDYEVRGEHTFHTQRVRGEEFVFTITSDSHHQMNTAHQQAMQNVLSDQPDFHLDLGDTFYPDNTTSQSAVNQDYLDYRAPLYMGAIGPSVPIFLASGNHENEEGWNFDDTPFSIALGSVQARKAYYPTPIDDGFYSGNTDPLAAIDEATYGDELRENYYAWEWGDALFVVINEFQYTMDLPYSPAAGEGSEPVTGDQWSWTLGYQQFNWFKQVIQNSDAKYKFVFSHQMLGGIPNLTVAGVGPGYVRGGAGAAPYFEWGGKNADGTEGFDTMRSGWGGVPIHQLMVENGVSAYFHGHDHQFVYESLDGVVYQEVPSPSMSGSGFSGIYDTTDSFTHQILPNAGHLRVTVSPSEATVEYVRSNQTGVSYIYTIAPNSSSSDPVLGDANGDDAVNSTDALIILSCDVGSDTSSFCPMNCADANADGLINSTDALIILSYDVGMPVGFPIGSGACPSSVTPCAGCNP